MVLQDYIHPVTDAEARMARLTGQIEQLLPSWSMAPVVMALQAMRGVELIVAAMVVAEVGDFSRFENPRQLMAYLGLVPSKHSSGGTVRRGGITKAGNSRQARLDRGAWSYRIQARSAASCTIGRESTLAEFRTAISEFLNNLHTYRDQLASLITDQFCLLRASIPRISTS